MDTVEMPLANFDAISENEFPWLRNLIKKNGNQTINFYENKQKLFFETL